MKKMNKAAAKLFKRDVILAAALLLSLLVMVMSVFASMIALEPGYVGTWRPRVPLAKATGAEGELRAQYFNPLTSCRNDNRTRADRMATFNTYFALNRDGDRAIMRGCNDIDQVYARIGGTKWYPLFTINADAKQDDAVRKACKIEDITVGEADTKAENQSANALKIQHCTNFLTNVVF